VPRCCGTVGRASAPWSRTPNSACITSVCSRSTGLRRSSRALPRRKQARGRWQPDDHRGKPRRESGQRRLSLDRSAFRRPVDRPSGGWPRLRPKTSTRFAARCWRPRRQRRSQPGSSSSAPTVATASESKFRSPTSVPELPRSSCYSEKDSAAPRRRRNQPPCHHCPAPHRGRSQGTRLGSAQGAGDRLPRDRVLARSEVEAVVGQPLGWTYAGRTRQLSRRTRRGDAPAEHSIV
jgi:hypothetical protein